MKTIATKKINVYLLWNGINLPPKQFNTIGELEAVSGARKTLAESIPDFVETYNKSIEFYKRMQDPSNPVDEKFNKERDEFNKKSKEQEEKQRDIVVSVDLEDTQFNTLFQIVESKGKDWFNDIDSFLEFRKDINQANSQAKSK